MIYRKVFFFHDYVAYNTPGKVVFEVTMAWIKFLIPAQCLTIYPCLMIFIWRQCQIPQVECSIPKDHLSFRNQCLIHVVSFASGPSRLIQEWIVFWNGHSIKQSFVKLVYQFSIKKLTLFQNSQMQKIYRAQYGAIFNNSQALAKAHCAPKCPVVTSILKALSSWILLGTLLIDLLIKLLTISHSLWSKAGIEKEQNKWIQVHTFQLQSSIS